MPHEVIMPALGMAQDSGLLVGWLKQPGDAVTKGDMLFEVETDKATMEVEAAADGFLTDVTAAKGDTVPVGHVIARISESADATPSTPAAAESAPEALPEGHIVIMPTLGMAQDSGLLVSWHKGPGDSVLADDVLFEVETDKSTMEVSAGADGFIAAQLASEGEDVPVGQTIAIISREAPAQPITRKAAAAPAPAPKATPAPAAKAPAPAPKAPPVPPQPQSGRILASPKLRRLAKEQGLDLAKLVDAGVPQPFHVKELEQLKALSAKAASAPAHAAAPRRLTAEITAEGFTAFAAFAATEAKLTDQSALLAGFAAASLGRSACVEVTGISGTQCFDAQATLAATTQSEGTPELRLRDLRQAGIATVQLGPEDTPTLTLTATGAGVSLTLECAHDQLTAAEAITLLSNFAGRMAQPLRHLL